MDPSCASCNKGPPEVALKRCAKCSTTPYCSRDCQKAHWKVHKKTCGKQQQQKSPGEGEPASGLSPPKGLDKPVAMPFTRLDRGTWLHHRPETDVYRLLIDTYRLRVEDNYKLEGQVDDDSIYGGAPDGLRGFRRFLDLTATRPGLLPPWWKQENKEACERLGMDASQWHDLRCAVEKSDVIEHYGDARFPMQLRMFGEAVFRRGPRGMDGTAMRKAMASREQGGMPGTSASILDITTMNASEIQ